MRLGSWIGAGIVLAAAGPAEAYQEAPMLAARVAERTLAPVDERLPDEPVVVEPVRSMGKYGGTWRRIAIARFDIGMASRLGYEPLVRWDRTGVRVMPGVASRWEIRDGGRTYVFHLRKGMRWSDGEPFTSADLRFLYEDVLLNRELSPVFPDWLTIGGEPGVIAGPAPDVVEFRFAQPYGVFLEMLAYRGAGLLKPKHYLKRYHPRYTEPKALQAEIEARGLDHWFQLYWRKSDPDENPDLPTLNPWTIMCRCPPPVRWSSGTPTTGRSIRRATSCPTSTASSTRSFRTRRSATSRP